MSSPEKDARWGLATHWAEGLGLDFGDFTYHGWQKLLDEAQRKLDKNPSEIPFWAAKGSGE